MWSPGGGDAPLWPPATPPCTPFTPPPPQGRLRQIASLLCKFVQAINSVSLGLAVWQQEWLESWAARRSSLGSGMRAASQWRRRITRPLSPPSSRFFFFPFLFAPAGPLRSSRQPAVKEVRLLETKAQGRPRVTGGIASFTAGPHLPFQSGAKPLI